MKKYEVEFKRTSYITVIVDADGKDAAETVAWTELATLENDTGEADWQLEGIESLSNLKAHL